METYKSIYKSTLHACVVASKHSQCLLAVVLCLGALPLNAQSDGATETSTVVSTVTSAQATSTKATSEKASPATPISSLAVIPSCADQLSIEGAWLQGGLVRGLFGNQEKGVVRFLGNQVPVSSGGQFMLGLGRDAPKQVTLQAMTSTGDSCEQTFAVEQRDYRIQRVNGVPKKTVNPGPEYYKRIRREAADARQARAQILDLPHYLSEFAWPALGPISGVYGSQRYYNGEPRRPHFGVDIARPTGTPVTAPAAGVITLAAEDMFFSGGTVILDHGQGLSSSFLHLSKLHVKVGQTIEQGEVIAEIGATGRVTGPHLDWRMNWLNQRVDPALLVPPMPR